MEIIRAGHMGFCGGVGRAIRMAEAALAEGARPEAGVWSVGPIIHNENAMRELEGKGLRVAARLAEVPDGATVVVRSHGEGPDFFKAAEARGLRLADATCPKVARIHALAADAFARGERVAIVGDAEHPEVRATRAWGGGARAAVIDGWQAFYEQAAESFEFGEALFVVSQTTYDKSAFEGFANEFRALNDGLVYQTDADPENEQSHGDSVALEWMQVPVKVENTICDATALRQDACRRLAEAVECMVVVGDRHSSNTKKLYEIAKSSGKGRAIFIDNKNEISLKHLCRYGKLGITAGASTPERIVEEVISSMSEFRSENYETNPMHEFMDEIDKSTRLPRNGDIVIGEVIQVTDSDVTVNLGCKKDGVIPKNEIGLEGGQTLHEMFQEGDEVQAKVLKNDDGEGNILLSKKRVVVSEHWDTIIHAAEEKTPIEVKVLREVNGGVIAAFSEVNGFIPLSQLSDRYVEKADEFVGQTLTVKVIRVDQKRNKVVLSHKAVLNEERQKRMQEIWDQLSVGDIIDGRVMRFTDYGAFVDIGGVDGLLHISEISWGKLRHPSDLLEINQEVKVKILSMNKEKEKISLGYKQNQPEPWTIINEKYTAGQVIRGRAVQIKDYGVFVEIEPGLDGLVHISEIAYRRVTEIADELEVGQEVSAKILEIDQVRKRISLSIKETLDKPSDDEFAAPMQEAPAGQPGDPSTEAFDENKDQEQEMPDPDGLDAIPDAEPVAGDPSTEVFDENKDQEQEMPDPDGLDAFGGQGEAPAEEHGPSEQLFDPDKDQEFEMPDPDGTDAIPAAEELAQPGDPSTQEFDEDTDPEQEIPDPDGTDAE
ncbi:MAG: 30S ribosomal protein S1 [Clostridiales Family XIII bacterium]|nr:30S ribosomal protein S1 [Clostridiales Family XIII bacterium]